MAALLALTIKLLLSDLLVADILVVLLVLLSIVVELLKVDVAAFGLTVADVTCLATVDCGVEELLTPQSPLRLLQLAPQ